MFICLILICALNAESKPVKESKDYVFVAEKQEDRFWQVWLWTVLKNAQRFAPTSTAIVCTRERQFWSLEVHNVRPNPSSLQQNYKIHCVHYPYLSVTERLGLSHPLTNWISFFCGSLPRVNSIKPTNVSQNRNSCLRPVGQHSPAMSLSKSLLGTLGFILHYRLELWWKCENSHSSCKGNLVLKDNSWPHLIFQDSWSQQFLAKNVVYFVSATVVT